VIVKTLLVIVILGCFALVMAFLATRHTAILISQPIIELSRVASEMTNGNYNSEMMIGEAVENGNEIMLLSLSFESMRLKIKEILEQLLIKQAELKAKR
jgi:HAMP domain-containing protein